MKPKEGCGGCGRREYGESSKSGCETLLDELRSLRLDYWRPSGVVFVWCETEVKEDGK